MKKFVFVLALIVAVISCKTENKKVEEIKTIETVETPMLAIGEFDSKAGEFVNKEIKINGIVDHVCKHGGKKILMATDEGNVHVNSDERFDEALKGSQITVTGIVVEERIDESDCLKMEEDLIKSHSEGLTNEEQMKAQKEHIQQYRDQMKAENKAYVSNYSLKYVNHSKVD
jgi:FtsZ-binding cell division protein ZapB